MGSLGSSFSGMGTMGLSSLGGMGSLGSSFGSSMGSMNSMGGLGGMGDPGVGSVELSPQLAAISNSLSNITGTSMSQDDMKAKVEAALAQLSGMTGVDNSLDSSASSQNRKLNLQDDIELDTGKTTEKNEISFVPSKPEPKLEKTPDLEEERKKSDSFFKKFEEKKQARERREEKHRKLVRERKKREEMRKRKLNDAYSRPMNVKLNHLPRHIKCSVTKKKIPKSFIIKNKKKEDFCEDFHKKIENYPLQDLYDYLENMKPTMRQMIGMKKTFYCSLCDREKQDNIDTSGRTITFTQGFCKTLVTDFQDYIKLHNVIFVKYFDILLQYSRCFTTLASENVFPKKSLLKEKLMRVKYINRCFENAHEDNFMDYCFYLCDQFSYTSLSGFFDGDVEFLKKINFFLLSFLRKYESRQPLTSPTLEEPSDLHSVNFDDPIYMEEQEKENLLLPPDDAGLPDKSEESEEDFGNPKYHYKNFIDVEMDETEEIYEGKKTKMIFDRFLPKFINDHKAINPFILDSHVNFNVDMKNLIQEQCKADDELAEEELKPEVLRQYFGINSQDLDDFKNDLFLPFADYNYFELEKKKKKEAMEEIGAKPKPDPEVERKKALAEYMELRPELGEVDGLTVNRLDDDESEKSLS